MLTVEAVVEATEERREWDEREAEREMEVEEKCACG